MIAKITNELFKLMLMKKLEAYFNEPKPFQKCAIQKYE